MATQGDSPFDVAVIGGGPAGMMAAGRAAELGARVVLLEKNSGLGKKLLITGGGRCNILNAESDAHILTAKYGKKGKSLFSLFSQLDADATREFFESRGLKIKVEAEKRAFPVSERAADVLETMKRYLRAGNVEIRTHAAVTGLVADGGTITGVRLQDGDVRARSIVLATGGKSHPETGSTGDGFGWLKILGHDVAEQEAALVPLTTSDAWRSALAGISLKDVKLTIWQDGTKADVRTGKMLFTHTGLSGPAVLNLSKRVGELLKTGPVTLTLDLFPTLDAGAVDRKVLEQFEQGKNKLIKNHVGGITQPRLAHVLLTLAGIDPDTPLRQLTREHRKAFCTVLKAMPIHVSGLLGTDKAVVTGGGLSLKDVDFKTMRSKRFRNLYLAGDILDFDRPSGGFSLQICWSTGYVAGTCAATT